MNQGRTTALSGAIAGLVALTAAGVACREQIVEQYHILRLRSADEALRLRSVQALVESRSVRAVPALIRLLGEDKREVVNHCVSSGMLIACGPGGCRMVPSQPEHSVRLTPIAHALYLIGRARSPQQPTDEGLEAPWSLGQGDAAEADNRLSGMLFEIRQAIGSRDLAVDAVGYEDFLVRPPRPPPAPRRTR